MPRAIRDRRKSERPQLRIDLNGVMEAVIGAEAGLQIAEVDALKPRLEKAIADLEAERAQGLRPFLDLPYQREAIEQTLALAERLRPDTDHFVMLGIGGSVLGARALAGALAPGGGRGGDGRIELVVADSIDPASFAAILDRVDLQRTVFNVVTKSGETPEALAQFLIVRDRLLREFGAAEYAKHLLMTTDSESGALRQIVNDEGFFSTEYPAALGGRFSVLSTVHLLPAALLDIDLEDLLAGAAAMDERCRRADVAANPAAQLAAARYLLDTLHGGQVAVLMPYSERLLAFAEWWRELWAACLGQRVERDGGVIAVGQTALAVAGAAAQHSQLQLYLDGPADKVITFLRVEDHGARLEVPSSYLDLEDVAYLGGRSLGELLNLEQRATEVALARRGRPTITIELPALTPFSVGQLLYLTELETVLAAALFGVDPYGQAGIEEAKRVISALAGRPGFSEEREEAERLLGAKQARWIL